MLVVGAGPGGMAAGAVAAESGYNVLLVDDNPSAGGQIWRGYAESDDSSRHHSALYAQWARRLNATGVEVLSGARVVDRPATGVLRVESEAGSDDIGYRRLILATGARERFLPFPGWTLPGVMGAGGLQAMVKAGLPIEGKRVVLSGSGPLLLAVAANLLRHGAKVAGIFEQAPLGRVLRFGAGLIAHPGKLMEGAHYRKETLSVPYRMDSWVLRAHGGERLQSVTVRSHGATRDLTCDYLGCGFHLVPNLELPRLLGCEIQNGHARVDAAQQSSKNGVYCVGELTGIGGLEKALVEGEIAGLAVAGRAYEHLADRRNRATQFARRLDVAFAPRAELRALADAETIVCRCEDVRRGALEGLHTGREAKLHTRCGMGACQGRVCGAATEFLFGWESGSVRPPILPSEVSTVSTEPNTPAAAEIPS